MQILKRLLDRLPLAAIYFVTLHKFMTMKTLITIILLLILSFDGKGQQVYPTRDSVHIFWQPDLKIILTDYKGDSTKEVMAIMRK